MILPTIFKDAEEDCRHLKSEVQVWDVSVQRQVEIVGKDAATLLELLTPRNVKDMNPNKCLYAPMVNQNGGMINDPVLLRVDEDRYWISIADSDVLLWVSGIAAALKLNVEVSDLNLNIDDQISNISIKPKMRPVNKINKFVTSKIRPKLRP